MEKTLFTEIHLQKEGNKWETAVVWKKNKFIRSIEFSDKIVWWDAQLVIQLLSGQGDWLLGLWCANLTTKGGIQNTEENIKNILTHHNCGDCKPGTNQSSAPSIGCL